MSKRITDRTSIQGAYSQLAGIERYLHQSGLDERLILLMKMRVSQINGCAYCLALHARHLRELGEREDRVTAHRAVAFVVQEEDVEVGVKG